MTNECFEWNAARNLDGYGRKWLEGKQRETHRLAWAWANWDGAGDWKESPEGKHVLHTCNNPPCCNPKHLYLGTHKDNMRDMTEAGHRISKLTHDDVRSIRVSEGTQVAIGKEFGVSRACIGLIKSGHRWGELV